MNIYPRSRRNDLVVHELDEEVLVYDLHTNRALCLNETAAKVWRACDGKNSTSDIASLIAGDEGGDVADGLVWLALDGLRNENLLEGMLELPTKHDGQSRRNVIKRIAFASLVTIPLISTVTAPVQGAAVVSCGLCACVVPNPVTSCPQPSFIPCPGTGCTQCIVTNPCSFSGGFWNCQGTCQFPVG